MPKTSLALSWGFCASNSIQCLRMHACQTTNCRRPSPSIPFCGTVMRKRFMGGWRGGLVGDRDGRIGKKYPLFFFSQSLPKPSHLPKWLLCVILKPTPPHKPSLLTLHSAPLHSAVYHTTIKALLLQAPVAIWFWVCVGEGYQTTEWTQFTGPVRPRGTTRWWK